jgi:hypothetical protein
LLLGNRSAAAAGCLPGGTSAPNTLITEYAVRKYHLQTQLSGWLIQAPAPLIAATTAALGLLGAVLGLAFAVTACLVLGARRPVRPVRRRAADQRADPAGRAAAGRHSRRLAIRRA